MNLYYIIVISFIILICFSLIMILISILIEKYMINQNYASIIRRLTAGNTVHIEPNIPIAIPIIINREHVQYDSENSFDSKYSENFESKEDNNV